MGGKKSSFRMENEVNGYGNTTYVKAKTQGVHPPLSQENVQLTPDFGKFILTVLGANPTVIIPANADPAFLSMLGAMASANQAIINKDQAGNYNVTFHLSEQSLTNGSYLQAMQTSSNVNKSNIGVVGKWELDGSRWRYYLNGYVKSQWVKYKDRWYYLDQNGYMALGWQTIGGKKYYLKSKKSKGLEAGGYMVTGWEKIDGTWYYFRSSGELLTNNWKQGKDGKWYFCGKNGAMATSKIVDWKGKKYFVDDDGVMAVNRTITDPETGSSYEANENGVLTQVVEIIYANAGTDADRLSITEQEANAKYIYKYLTNEGWSMESIAGLCGNIEIESHFNPGVWQKHHSLSLGYGLVQSTASRFLDYAGLDEDSADQIALQDPKCLLDLELEFIIWECQPKQSIWLQGSAVNKYGAPYKMSFSDFIASTNSPSDLALVFHGHYERSSDDQSRRNKRASNAKAWYKYFSNL